MQHKIQNLFILKYILKMKKLLLAATLILHTLLNAWALQSEVNWNLFYAPNKGMYVESYVLIPASTVQFATNTKGIKQAQVELITTFTQGDKIVKADRYVLNSIAIKDTLTPISNLIDQQRTLLPDGNYTWEIQFKDLNNANNTTTFKRDIVVQSPTPNRIFLSDIMLVEQYSPSKTENQYSRNGYDLVPNILYYFPQHLNRLAFYAEIYQTDQAIKDPDFLVKYYIANKGAVQATGKWQGFKKMNPAEINVLFADFDISELYSGNYEIVIEVRNKQNELISVKRSLFQRNKKNLQPTTDKIEETEVSRLDFQNIDIAQTFVSTFTLADAERHLLSITPLLVNQSEMRVVKNLLSAHELSYAQRYLYRFWERINPANPKNAFNKYQTDLIAMDEKYGTPFQKGFETERGRVHLRYGKPNEIIATPNDPVAFPYEVWHYYQLADGQKDIKFIFFQPDESGDYRLIHSDAKEEPYEPNWKRWVFNRARKSNVQDANNNQRTDELDYFGNKGRQADDYFKSNNSSNDRPTKEDE